MLHRLRLLVSLLLLLVLPLAAEAQSARRERLPEGYARLVVITNHENTEVSINNVSYPYAYIYDNNRGVLMPANTPFQLKVSVATDKTRHFRLNLREGETRVIVVDVENMGMAPTPAPERPATPDAPTPSETTEEENSAGFLGVSSSPRGTVIINESNTGQRTPARRIELEPGRHRIQVIYDDSGETSETKYVLIRAGTNTNVFFRQRRTAE